MSETTVADAPDQSRYEARVDGKLAGFAAYTRRGTDVVFTHTQVDDDFEGRGVGSRLVRSALDDVRARGLLATPLCPFVAAFIADHQEYADLTAPAG